MQSFCHLENLTDFLQDPNDLSTEIRFSRKIASTIMRHYITKHKHSLLYDVVRDASEGRKPIAQVITLQTLAFL